tara:strand:+ start:526 stop:705 length:180 start_codon:yes stop_codon:yes gene_type:complete
MDKKLNMTYQEAKKIVGNQPISAIKNMVEVLSWPVSKFLNTDEDNERLQAGKIILKGNK